MRTVFKRLWKTGLWLLAGVAVAAPSATLIFVLRDHDAISQAELCMSNPEAKRELGPREVWLTPDHQRAYVIESAFTSLGVEEVPQADVPNMVRRGYRPATMQEVYAKRCNVSLNTYGGKSTFYAQNAVFNREMYTAQPPQLEQFFYSLLALLPLIAWWGFGNWVGWLARPGAPNAAAEQPPSTEPPGPAPPSPDAAKRDAMELLGWNGESMSDEAFKRLRKNAMNLWHPDKREAYVASTGKSGAYFDAMSGRVMAALQWLQQNAVTETGNVVGW
jgi:hypothetical protein